MSEVVLQCKALVTRYKCLKCDRANVIGFAAWEGTQSSGQLDENIKMENMFTHKCDRCKATYYLEKIYPIVELVNVEH
jgi:DNA-directed RNA polymerase subunit RPC12/RpoP